MQKCILVKSVTHAQKAKSMLSAKGITSYISKQKFSPANGCSWCIKVRASDLDRAVEILKGYVKMTGEIFDV